jgi:hypothetical protein
VIGTKVEHVGRESKFGVLFFAAGLGGEIHRGAAYLLSNCIYYNIIRDRDDSA